MDIQPAPLEKAKLTKLGISFDALSRYDVICLPENVFQTEKAEDLHDADDSIHLAKLLKASDVRCATALDLGLDVPFLERRSSDIWLGVVWLGEHVVLPVVIGVIVKLITSKQDKKSSDRVTPTVHLDLYIERVPNVVTLSYKGDGKTLAKVLKSIVPEKEAP